MVGVDVPDWLNFSALLKDGADWLNLSPVPKRGIWDARAVGEVRVDGGEEMSELKMEKKVNFLQEGSEKQTYPMNGLFGGLKMSIIQAFNHPTF